MQCTLSQHYAIAVESPCLMLYSVPDGGCCSVKTVGGVVYSLLGVEDTSDYECLDNCVYTIKDSPGDKICFKAGDIMATCTQQ